MAFAGLLIAAEARADPMPSGLRRKSLALSWTVVKTQKALNGPQAGRVDTSETLLAAKVYVSLQGRVFSSYSETTGRNFSGVFDEVTGSAENVLQWRFEGDALVAYKVWVQGARRTTVSFSDGFAACSIAVTFGKKNAQGPLVVHGWPPYEDRQFEIIDYKISSPSCSVRPGNIFGDAQ